MSTESTTIQGNEALQSIEWPLRLFNRSILKQRKYIEITSLLGPTNHLSCLDIGGDNGVISYLLRQRGGEWKSADLDEGSVRAIAGLVGTEVYQLDGGQTPFNQDTFDRVVIIDFLEHIPNDRDFIDELYRVMKPQGDLIVNVPHRKNSLLRRFRHQIGQTDEKHGHLRPGYTLQSLTQLMEDRFTIQAQRTYSKFFSELLDTLIVFGVSLLKKGEEDRSRKGLIVTGQDLDQYRSSFKLYSLVYPIVWLFSKLDHLLFFRSGYMLIVKARVKKEKVGL